MRPRWWRGLREEPGKDIVIPGQRRADQVAHAHSLIDRYILQIAPLVLFGSTPLRQ